MKLLERGEMWLRAGQGPWQTAATACWRWGNRPCTDIHNLEAKGLIASRQDAAENGRPRKYYSLTGKGKTPRL
ncbi:MAG: PadR family transcriptional regulator [Phycisphaerales bacterium]